MQCPWGCGLLKEGGCKSCRFKFQWLLDCGWKEESSKVYMVKKRNSIRRVAPTRNYKDCLSIDADTGNISSDRQLPPELTKWNKRHKVMKSDERNGWNITSKKRRDSSRKERQKIKKSKVFIGEEVVGPVSMNLEKVEKIEQRMEIVDFLTYISL